MDLDNLRAAIWSNFPAMDSKSAQKFTREIGGRACLSTLPWLTFNSFTPYGWRFQCMLQSHLCKWLSRCGSLYCPWSGRCSQGKSGRWSRYHAIYFAAYGDPYSKDLRIRTVRGWPIYRDDSCRREPNERLPQRPVSTRCHTNHVCVGDGLFRHVWSPAGAIEA